MKKSLIPLQENQGPKVLPRALKIPSSPGPILSSPRKPLTPIQGKLGKVPEDEMVGRKAAAVSVSLPCSDGTKAEVGAKAGPSRINLKKVQAKTISKRKSAEKLDKAVQTDTNDLELITGDEPPLVYWKELALTRGDALEEALKENEELTAQVEALEKEKQEMAEIVAQAQALADMVSAAGIAAEGADESGIGGDVEDADTSVNTSTY